ncbi:uncharacterized protein LOC124336177 isoform X2 [Daphnia pulicaria]|uniref:uncharacterized protein LOC124336177 isoform X2 n=1 Tax=Daphnia pulicaria TaxID=35523 RepID=UPI001EE9BA5D|nr:uncharacterized protein LOC124336177 isoform X2 [Daphnia pulicaria]
MWRLISLALSFVFYLSAINRGDAAPVTSVDEAAGYLARFGYLDRGHQNSSYSAVKSAKSFSDAIKDFQSFAGLNKTGKLDTETKKLMNKPRCGVPDRVRPGSSSTRQKRFALQGSKWPKKQLTYKIKKYTTDMSKSDVDREIARAFQMWADVTDLTFVHLNQSANVDIEILFASGEHGDCPPFNDGPGGVLAHAAFPVNGGGAHFDESETWTLNSDKGTNLFQVATHEFGHSLGLDHVNVSSSTAVMYPYHEYSSKFKLDKGDIEGIQKLYGINQLGKFSIELKGTEEELEKAKKKWKAELKGTKQELETAIADLSKKVDNLILNLNGATTSEIVDIGKMPTSCTDLQQIGHKLSGFFLVKGSKKMETVYCNFYSNGKDLQKKIGYADVKSAPVHFYVQRKNHFNEIRTPIPFEVALVNEGNAMDLASGKFTAPRRGIYFFSFTGIAEFPDKSLYSFLKLYFYSNDLIIGHLWIEESTQSYQRSPGSLQFTLSMKPGDQVWVAITELADRVYLFGNEGTFTHFTGFMLEEEIATSL